MPRRCEDGNYTIIMVIIQNASVDELFVNYKVECEEHRLFVKFYCSVMLMECRTVYVTRF